MATESVLAGRRDASRGSIIVVSGLVSWRCFTCVRHSCHDRSGELVGGVRGRRREPLRIVSVPRSWEHSLRSPSMRRRRAALIGRHHAGERQRALARRPPKAARPDQT